MRTLLFPFLLSLSAFGVIPDSTDLPLVSSIIKDGVTWEFEHPVRAGKFVNGDYYILGNATIVKITPVPQNGRNGSVLNPPLNSGISGFDDRVQSNRFREDLRIYPPIDIKPGDVLISSISIDTIGSIKSWLRESEIPASPIKSISILTCLRNSVSEDAFRPSYGDTFRKIYHASDLKRDLLPNLQKVGTEPDIKEFSDHFLYPWFDVCFFSFDAAVGYQPAYGREIGRAVGMAALLLALNYTQEEKEPLLIGFVQYAIDLWGMAQNGYGGWPAHGGHGSGRKLPIVLAGILLGNKEMASPTKTNPDLKFGEDMQTMYDKGWTGATVVYAGHQGVYKGQTVSTQEGWGPYENLPPSEWPNELGEEYRRCCTSIAWIGEALAARIFGAIDNWGHPAFFDYCDRWMTEDDSVFVEKIKEEKGWDFSPKWERQGQCWDAFVNDMWNKYRFVTTPSVPAIYKTHWSRRNFGIKRFFSGIGNHSDLYIKKLTDNSQIIEVFDISGKKINTVQSDDLQKLFSKTSAPGKLLLLNFN